MINVHSMIPVRRIMRQRHHGNHRLLDLRIGKVDVVVGRIVREGVDKNPIVACRKGDGVMVVRQRASERASERMKGGERVAGRGGKVLWDAT